MNLTPSFRQLMVALTLSLVLTRPLAAQNLLYVEHEGKPCLVLNAHGIRPCIEINGKLTDVAGPRMALKKVDEYLPVFVAVRNLEMHSTYDTVDGAGEVNTQMKFRARFETPYQLDDVFLLLEMTMDKMGKTLFLYEVGRLEPREPKQVALNVPLTSPLGGGHFQLHIFAGGAEVLHSEISSFERERSLDRMIAKRIASVQNAGPKPFIGPTPEYPATLLKANLKGEAVISIRVRNTGSGEDLTIKSATDPAFGEAALVAARMWRFLPRVKDGRPVETKVDMPFLFTPPGKPAGKS